jgi:hypothetical protein
MNLITVVLAVSLPLACIAVAAALMRLFDVRDATTEQAQVEAERLLSRVNHDVQTRRRVRAGAPGSITPTAFPQLSSLRTTRMRFPSAQLSKQHVKTPL